MDIIDELIGFLCAFCKKVKEYIEDDCKICGLGRYGK
jgi:hypothetical protein